MHDLKRILELIKNFKVKTFVCVNKYDLNKNITDEIKNLCLKEKCNFAGKIAFNTSFVKAVSLGKTVVEGFDNNLTANLEKIWHNVKRG